MKENQDYKNAALAALRGNWTPAVVATLIFMTLAFLISGASGGENPHAGLLGLSGLAIIFALYPLQAGYSYSFLLLFKVGDNQTARNMFHSGFDNWLHNVWTMFLMNLYIILWSLLFLIPGIIKSLAYAMTPFILIEHPELTADQAIDLSRAMMKGHKFDLFYLYLSFIGWALLAILTCGIGFLWLEPYMMTSLASFYEDLKADCEVSSAKL